MPDLLVGATAGLSSSASMENTAGQASSGTQTIIPLCHMPSKRTELLRTAICAIVRNNSSKLVAAGLWKLPQNHKFG